MRKFRKKPVVIEAVQFFSDQPMPEGVYFAGGECWIDTLEGSLIVRDGDWIITGVVGEKYPCKPDIFAKTYEPVTA